MTSLLKLLQLCPSSEHGQQCLHVRQQAALQHENVKDCPVCSPPTALRMLEEFVDLKEGDVIVQNGANSAVGQVRPSAPFQAIGLVAGNPVHGDVSSLDKRLAAACHPTGQG